MKEYTVEFNLVWDSYRAAAFPNPAGSKFEAFEIWRKNKLPKKEDLIEAIRIQKSNDNYRRDKKEFVAQWKHFCRWLKGRCWEDLIDLKDIEKQKKDIRKQTPALPDYSKPLSVKMKPVEPDIKKNREELYQQVNKLMEKQR
jgi:hypothetical protein